MDAPGEAPAAAPRVAERIWRRFTFPQRLTRFAVYLAMVAAIVVSVQTVEVIPEFLADAPEQVADLLSRMWPIDFAHYPDSVHAALMETIHIATLGTLLSLVLALPVGVLAANNLVPATSLNLAAKLILVSSRSVNSLVWALLFVGIFGPGALAGTLAIAFRSIGFVGKLFGEALEETQAGPDRGAHRRRGAMDVADDVRLLAAGEAGVLVDRAVPLGHQRPRVGGARAGRCGRHRHDARFGAQPLPVEPRRGDPARDLRRRDPRGNRRDPGPTEDHFQIVSFAAMGVIAVFNQKGGVGKTTTALNLLATIAQRGKRPIGIDLDPQAHLSHIFGLQPRLADDSVYSFFVRGRQLADVAQITRSGVVVCPAHLELAKIDSLLGKSVNVVTKLRHALHEAGAPAGPVVIDCSPLLNVLSLNAIFACDVLLVPVSCDYLSMHGAQQVERALNALEPVFKRRLPRRYLLTRFDATAPDERRRGHEDGRGASGPTRSAGRGSARA